MDGPSPRSKGKPLRHTGRADRGRATSLGLANPVFKSWKCTLRVYFLLPLTLGGHYDLTLQV